jgi:hypothetical protein
VLRGLMFHLTESMMKTNSDDVPENLFVYLKRIRHEAVARAKIEDFERLGPVEKAEFRGATLATASFYRCLGSLVESFADDGLMDRIHARMLAILQRGAAVDGPRPLAFGEHGASLNRIDIHSRKKWDSVFVGHLDVGIAQDRRRVWVGMELDYARHYFDAPAKLSRVQVMLGVGLLSDLTYSEAAQEYVFAYPELTGQHFGSRSALMGLDEPLSLDLRVDLPLEVPEGVHLVVTVWVWFLDALWDEPFMSRIGSKIVEQNLQNLRNQV